MGVLHVFDCKDCSVYTRIPVLDYQDLSVMIFTDVMSFVASTIVKDNLWRTD